MGRPLNVGEDFARHLRESQFRNIAYFDPRLGLFISNGTEAGDDFVITANSVLLGTESNS